MANEIVKPHKFEVSKNKIHSLSTSVSNVSLQKFPTEGSIFPWNDHNITGDEANTLLVSPLQSALISQNTSIRSLFNIADEVYNALESLDKEYIQGIIAAVKSAEIASDQAKAASTKANTASNQALEASRKALDASTKATTAQADIKRTIEALQTTVRILKEFKEKVTKDLSSIASLNTRITSVNSKIQDVENKISDVADSAKKINDFQPIFSNLNHIKDVDQIWNDLKSSREVVKGLIDTLTPFMSRVNDADKELHGEINKISTLLESYQHLGDVDAIWSDVEGHKTNLASFHQQVDAFVEKVNQATARIDGDIEALKQYRTLLESYQHLGDVDAIWSDVEGHKTNLASFHQQVDAFVEKVNQATARIDGDIEALKQYRTLLESYQHLGDVDAIWSDVEGHKTNLASFHQQVDAFVEKVNQATARIDGDIEALKQYRTLLESYQHLGDVDAIWSDVEGHKTNLASFHQQVDAFVEKVNQATARINGDIEALKQYRTLLESYQHLGDVDAIWSDVEGHKTNLASFHQQVDAFVEKVNQATARIDGDIEALKQYRTLLESYQHLGDVDAIWSDVEGHKTNLASFHQQVDAFVEKVNQATARIDGDIEALKQYRTLLESYQHLGDVDAIWSNVEGHKTNLASFHQQVDAFVEKVNQATARIDGDIEALKQYRTLLESYQHLGDVDAIWSDVKGHKTDLLGLHEKFDEFIEETHLGLERIEGLIHQLEKDNYHAHLQYNKKIKVAFWLGGSAVGFIVINYILQIIGVL